MPQLQDQYQRTIDYLRISITDHCNLKCQYCVPFDGRPKLPMSEILTYEEMFEIAKAAVANGVTKIRVTGGEPLMRRDMIEFCRKLSSLRELTDLAVTTNGVLLASMAADLKAAGVNRVNVSLDTLNAERYAQITGKDRLGQVLKGIEAAEQAGLAPIKINMVPMRGINDDEIADMARWTLTKPYDIRFIELMPTSGWAQNQHSKLFISIEEVRKAVAALGRLEPIAHIKARGPAVYERLAQSKGRIGFIAALSHHFCKTCNRLRLTADGKLRACLFADKEVDIITPLRNGATMERLRHIIRATAAAKPERHRLNDQGAEPVNGRTMRAIGG
ncbi:MAG: GTP 3',8-cyclase MoaA [Desulfobacteraceae bacterium]|jgi:cyclic pyranopterin phosphate synthase